MVRARYHFSLALYAGVPGGKVSIMGAHSVGHSKQKVSVYMCPIANGFRGTTLSRSLDLAPSTVIPSRRTAPLSEAYESV
jgi:hypothetical protein